MPERATVGKTMPFGLCILMALSFFIFRRARAARRNPWVWIGALWSFSIGLGMAVSLVVVGWLLIVGGVDLEQQGVRSFLWLPTLLGMSCGAAVAMWCAGPRWQQTPDTTAETNQL